MQHIRLQVIKNVTILYEAEVSNLAINKPFSELRKCFCIRSKHSLLPRLVVTIFALFISIWIAFQDSSWCASSFSINTLSGSVN